MQNRSRGVVLVVTQDVCCRPFSTALAERGFQVITAYSSESAEFALGRYDVGLAVVDAEILAADPESRQRAILAAYPNLRFVIINASRLSAQAAGVFAAHLKKLLANADTTQLVEAVEELVSQPAGTSLEEGLGERTHHLGQRIKELQCFNTVMQLTQRLDISMAAMLQKVVDVIPAGWQFPEVACARISVYDQEFCSRNFRETISKQTADLTTGGNKIGAVEVCYLEERPVSDEGPFVEQEVKLLHAIARQLGEAIETRRQATINTGRTEPPGEATASGWPESRW